MRRKAVKTLAAIVVLMAIASLGSYVYLRQSLPDIDGSIEVPGLTAPLDIVRDADSIPHVIAVNRLDALFGLGYVHAQDRLWQMELQRRIGHGRLSEILGAAAISQDRFLRTVGFGRAARTSWERMGGEAREQINAYVAGVNAFLADHHGSQLPPEFTLLRFEPEPWTGADVVVWVKMMAWDLSANYSLELLRHDLVRAVGIERMQQLMPPYAPDGLSILAPGGAEGPGESGRSGRLGYDTTHLTYPTYQTHPTYPTGPTLSAAFTSAFSGGDPSVREVLIGGAKTEGIGSNNWVVDGTLTASGKPLLANDPHLSTRIPSTWYLAHVSGGDLDVIGATLPGTPAVALGRNRFIAWGATNVAADVQDLYRERLDPTGRFAEFRGAMESLTIVPETIVVKGGAPVQIDVRLSRHGPLVSDAINANNAELPGEGKPRPLEPLAFRWSALDESDTTLASFLKLNGAKNWADFTAALRDFVAPSQNFVYGDVDGHIGYYAPGRIPIRANGDGALPAEGWTGDAEWTGWVPFDDLPHVADPPEHFIVTANNRPAGAPYPHRLGLDWVEPYRAQRIVDLLKQKASFTPQDFARIQADTLSLHAKALLPVLMAHTHPDSVADRQALDLLRQWSFDASADSAATAIFQAWFLQLAPTLVGDELGPAALDDYQGRFTYITRFVIAALSSGDSPWCDDTTTTAKRETCDEEITKALSRGVADLTSRLGANMGSWRWDGVHRAIFPHQGLDAVGMLRPWLSRSVPNGGDWSTINVGPVSAGQRYEQRSVAGYREIIDLSPANDSRFLHAVGESGHPMSPYYDDFLPDWRAVKYRRMRMERADIDRAALGRLRLTPQ